MFVIIELLLEVFGWPDGGLPTFDPLFHGSTAMCRYGIKSSQLEVDEPNGTLKPYPAGQLALRPQSLARSVKVS